MSSREVIVLGTSSQVPTRSRGHNALFLRWDEWGILFDPGEGTQRQMLRAGIAATQITHIAITHFHGDHCLGLAALVQRISLDRVPHAVEVIFPQSGQVYFDRLRHASIYHDHARIAPRPFPASSQQQVVSRLGPLQLLAHPLDHRVDCYGYRLQEPDGRRMLPEKLEAAGIRGPAVGQLVREGSLRIGERLVQLDEVSEYKRGQSFALVMDTRPCAGAERLAHNVDLLVSESTYLSSEEQEAHEHYHMTATQAAMLAKKAGVKKLVLTHFSQRYASAEMFLREAQPVFEPVVAAKDFTVVAVPPRD